MRRTVGAIASVWVLALAGLAMLSGCDSPEAPADDTAVAGAFQACPTSVVVSRTSSAPAATSPAAASGPQALPDLSLPCLAGGPAMRLRELGQPAVINLWASWCAPCRAELPEFQRLADSSDGRFVVLGVVTEDSRTASSSLAADLGVNFPALFDQSAELRRAVAPQVLPVTLFVDASGVVRHVDYSGQLALADLRDLVREHLGVVLP